MIGFFPKIYEDELLFSQISRYYQRAGYCLYSAGLDDIYSNRVVRPSIEFVNRLNEDAYKWITKYEAWDSIIINHTMFPWYARFLETVRRKQSYDTLYKCDGNISNVLLMPKQGKRSLRYCPSCAKEDRQRYGETYWHRKHQIARIDVCPKHKCYLEDTKVSMSGKKSTPFCAAETEVPYNSSIRICVNEKEIEFAEFVLNVFSRPFNMNSSTASALLRGRLDTKYKLNDYIRNLNELHTDISCFFDGMDVMNESQMRSIYNSKAFDAYFICQAAFFEGISTEELTDIPEEDISTLNGLYKELSEKYNIDFRIVSLIGRDISNYIYEQNNIHKKTGKVYNYDKMDAELLPKVKECVERILRKEGRPQKVSVASVERMLALPQRKIDKLPMCKKYIEDKMETQEEYWAREVVWAVTKIKAENEPMNWKHIRNLTNMRPDNLVACIKHIDNEEVSKILLMISS